MPTACRRSRPATPRAHKTEGAFYLWRADELDALLGDDAPIVKRRFGIEPDGNAPQRSAAGVHRQEPALRRAIGRRRSRKQTGAAAERGRRDPQRARGCAMFEARLERPRPHLDDKVLTAWNGLMIAAFARMARVFRGIGRRRPRGRRAVSRGGAPRRGVHPRADVERRRSGTLLRRYRDGHAEIDGYAEDYAYLIFGLLELFQADPDADVARVGDRAAAPAGRAVLGRGGGRLVQHHRHGSERAAADEGGLRRRRADGELGVGAEPARALAPGATSPHWTDRIERTLRLFGTRLEQMGRGVPMMAAALSAYTAGLKQIVIVEGEGRRRRSSARSRCSYLPFAIQLRVTPERQRALAGSLPFLAAMRPVDGATAAYVCRDFTCRQPVTTVDALKQELEWRRPHDRSGRRLAARQRLRDDRRASRASPRRRASGPTMTCGWCSKGCCGRCIG